MSRPKRWGDYVGNGPAKKLLQEAILAAQKTDTVIPHILIYGSAGQGKTTISNIIGNEAGYKVITTIGSAIRFQVDILRIINDIMVNTQAGYHTILFIDEIHNLDKQSLPETIWYPILEDFVFYSNLCGKIFEYHGESFDIVSNVHQADTFTIIGATTDPGMLSAPLRRRFKIQIYIEDYSIHDIIEIIRRYGTKEGYFITTMAAEYIAERSRDNPATAISLIDACIRRHIVTFGNHSEAKNHRISKRLSSEVMHDIGIRDHGLKSDDIKVLRTLSNAVKGMGQSNLAKSCGLSTNHYTELIEPFLKRRGWITTTHKTFITEAGQSLIG